jgi:hypothetical protein
MELMRKSGVKSYGSRDYESYGPLNRLFRWGTSGLKKESQNDYYENKLKNTQDNKSKDILKQASSLGVAVPEGNLFADEHKLLEQTEKKIGEYNEIKSNLKKNLGVDVENVQQYLDDNKFDADAELNKVAPEVRAIMDQKGLNINDATEAYNKAKQEEGWDTANKEFDAAQDKYNQMKQGLKDRHANKQKLLGKYNQYADTYKKDKGYKWDTLESKQFNDPNKTLDENIADAEAYYDKGEKKGTSFKNRLQQLIPGGETGMVEDKSLFEKAYDQDVSKNTRIDDYISDVEGYQSRGWTGQLSSLDDAEIKDRIESRDEQRLLGAKNTGESYFKGGLQSPFAQQEISKIKDTELKDYINQNLDSGKSINELQENFNADKKAAKTAKDKEEFDKAQTLFNQQNEERKRKSNQLSQWNQKMTSGELKGVNPDWQNEPTFQNYDDAEKYFKQENKEGIGGFLERVVPGGESGTSSMYDQDVAVQKKRAEVQKQESYQTNNARQIKMLKDPKLKNMKPFAQNLNFLQKKFGGDFDKMLNAVEGGHGGNFTYLIESLGVDGVNSLNSQVASQELGMDVNTFENFRKIADKILEKRGHYHGR